MDKSSCVDLVVLTNAGLQEPSAAGPENKKTLAFLTLIISSQMLFSFNYAFDDF